MPKHRDSGQSTDAENSRAPLKVSRDASNKVKSSNLGSFDALAESDRTGVHPSGADQTFQKVPAGI